MKKGKLSLAELLKSYRLEADISQKELSDKLGYTSSQFISNWERGISGPPMDKLEEICGILGIPQAKMVETILFETEQNLMGHFKSHKAKSS